MAQTFEKATVFNFNKMIAYSDSGVISKQVLKNQRETSRSFRSMKEKVFPNTAHLMMPWCKCWKEKLKSPLEVRKNYFLRQNP